jgi:hypothetical protein
VTTHIGIQLKITTPVGDLLRQDSDELHWKTQYITGFLARPQWQLAMTSDDPPWAEIFPGEGYSFNGSRDVLVMVRPVLLPDEGHSYEGDPEMRPRPAPWWQRWRYGITRKVRKTRTAVPV